MKINPINTNYTINRSFYSKEKENKFSNNTISKNCILDYLNCLSQYNVSFSGSKTPLYAIDEDGNYRRFSSRKEASEALGVTEPTVIFCANGLLRGVKGRTIVKATYIESFDKGKIVYNSELLKKFAAEAGKLSDRPIVAIGEDKKKRKYKNKASAAKSLNIRSDKISRCLKGEQKTTGGFRFVYADTLEKRKRRSSTIYAIKGINEVKEYKDIDEASEMLGLEKDEIIFFLKKGRTKDKQTTLNGYVFATGNDD